MSRAWRLAGGVITFWYVIAEHKHIFESISPPLLQSAADFCLQTGSRGRQRVLDNKTGCYRVQTKSRQRWPLATWSPACTWLSRKWNFPKCSPIIYTPLIRFGDTGEKSGVYGKPTTRSTEHDIQSDEKSLWRFLVFNNSTWEVDNVETPHKYTTLRQRHRRKWGYFSFTRRG